jgi:2'-5' RNA ligase
MAIRAFMGIDLPPIAKEALQGLAGKLSPLGARPVSRQNMHITLLFLGGVPEPKIQQITEAMERIKAKRFVCGIDGVFLFPEESPKIVSCRITKGVKELEAINNELAGQMNGLGFALEKRKFMAHLTLARCTPSTDIGALKKLVEGLDGPSLEFVCDKITLKSSQLSGSSPIHKDLFVRTLGEG